MFTCLNEVACLGLLVESATALVFVWQRQRLHDAESQALINAVDKRLQIDNQSDIHNEQGSPNEQPYTPLFQAPQLVHLFMSMKMPKFSVRQTAS